MTLHDYIYVDLDKIASLYSQLTGGVVEIRETNAERVRSTDNKRRYDFKLFRLDAGGTDESKDDLREVVKPHHAIIMEMERELTDRGYLVDLSASASLPLREPSVRDSLKHCLCVKVRGMAVIEDYERMNTIAQVFPDILKLIAKSAEMNLRKSPDFVEIEKTFQAAEAEVAQTKDKNKRSQMKRQVDQAKKLIDDRIAAAIKTSQLDQWILDGLQTWIRTFLPGITNIRIYNPERGDEHVFGHLKSEYFEGDSRSFHFTYGSMPTEELTMVGIVTSVPGEGGSSFDPLKEFADRELADYESVERVFRAMFRGFDGMEQLIRTCRYPRVLVHPLALYRSVKGTPADLGVVATP